MRQVRDRIASVDADRIEMADWSGDPSEEDEVVVLNGEGECGTTGCIAGHAVAVVTGELIWGFNEEGYRQYFDGHGQPIKDMRTTGENILGLSSAESERIFYKASWPMKYQDIAEEETQQKAVVSLLDDLIDGLLVWDEETYTFVDLNELEERLAAEVGE